MLTDTMAGVIETERRRGQRTPAEGMRAVIADGRRGGSCAQVKDLSRGGIALLTHWHAPVGQTVGVSLDGAMAPITGRVTRVQSGMLIVTFDQHEANLALLDQAMRATNGRRSGA